MEHPASAAEAAFAQHLSPEKQSQPREVVVADVDRVCSVNH